MFNLSLCTSTFSSQYPWPSPPYSDLSESSPPSSFVLEQDDYVEDESSIEPIELEGLPINIKEMYQNGDEKLKELIYFIFSSVKKERPSVLTSPFSPENMQSKVLEKNPQLHLHQKKTTGIFESDDSVILTVLDSNLSKLFTLEKYIQQEIKEWRNIWEIAASLVDKKYAKNLPEAKFLINCFIEKHKKYKYKINRNSHRDGSSQKNVYVHLISKALRYGIKDKNDILSLILIKSNFNITFKTARTRFYDFKKFAYSAKFSDEKSKKCLLKKKEKYLALIQKHQEKIDQLQERWTNKNIKHQKEYRIRKKNSDIAI